MKRMKSSRPKGQTKKWANLCPYDGFEYTHIGQFVTHARENLHSCLICLKCDHVSLTREQATIHSSSYDHRSVPPEAHPYRPIDRDITISVTPLNHPPIDFHVRVLERVEQLKQRIEAKLGCQKKSQSLLFGFTELEDTHTLLDYGVLHGDNISLIVKLKGGASPGLEVVADPDPSFEAVPRKDCYMVQQNIKLVQKRGCEAAISPNDLETIETSLEVQQNIKLVQKRGCEVAISPNDLETIEPSLENETCSKHYPLYSISCQCIGPWAVPNVVNK